MPQCAFTEKKADTSEFTAAIFCSNLCRSPVKLHAVVPSCQSGRSRRRCHPGHFPELSDAGHWALHDCPADWYHREAQGAQSHHNSKLILCSRQEVRQGIANRYHSGQDDVTSLKAFVHLDLVFLKLSNIFFSNDSSEWLRQVVVFNGYDGALAESV